MRFCVYAVVWSVVISVVSAQSDLICGQVLFSGKHESLISAEVATEVVAINKELGDAFAVGDVILELDPTVAKAEYVQAKAELLSAQEELKTLQKLYDNNTIQKRSEAVVTAASENLKTLTSLHSSGSVTDIDLANAKRDLAVAAADHTVVVSSVNKELNAVKLGVARAMRNVAFAKKNFESCTVRAPFAGKVEKLFVKKFEQVQPSRELVKLVSDRILIGRYLLHEASYTQIQVGVEVAVNIPVLKTDITGKVTHIDPVIDPASRTFEVRIEVDNVSGVIRPGMMGVVND